MQASSPLALPPETLEGWYVLHQLFRGAAGERELATAVRALAVREGEGWSAAVRVVGSRADWMVMHFRATLGAIGEAQRALTGSGAAAGLQLVYSFLSVTEAGLYHITAELAREAVTRGGMVGDDAYRAAMEKRATVERESAHVRRRLYPALPEGMGWACFYPMSKKRDAGANWYSLTLDERSRLMHSHGLTGRKYAGKIVQVISGAIGLDAWEWGVTLFAKDPLEFKKIVTEMRFDEVSAKYGEFGEFFVGELL
ncbi:MAG: Chlorite dismutase [Gemmatimonadetes bacterium]|nr:Chlorite dismutase [Gemmatimonadota bacterium]